MAVSKKWGEALDEADKEGTRVWAAWMRRTGRAKSKGEGVIAPGGLGDGPIAQVLRGARKGQR